MQRLFSAFTNRSALSALLIAALLLIPSFVFAQQSGTITGTVADATGAVVPGAKVTLVNQATKDTRSSVSNGEGYFAFPAVASGNYTIKVEVKGFKSWEQKDINILPGDKKHLSNIAMTVGAASEVISVEGTASQIQILNSGEKSSTLSAETIDKIALQGRDVTELLKVLPGFNQQTANGGDALGAVGNKSSVNTSVTGIGSTIGNGFNSNGLGRNGQDLMVNGAHVIDPGCNCNATQTVNGDMIAEVKVSTSNFGADAPKGPIVVQAVGKSGTSSFHGMGYTHIRHSSLNANDWDYNAKGLARPDTKYIYPGGQIGGPIRIPGTSFNKSNPKAFFFAGFEMYRQTFPNGRGPLAAVVPTADMRNGNFDPTTPANAALCSNLGGWQPQCGGAIGTWIPDPSNPTGPWIQSTSDVLPASAADPTGIGKALFNMMPLPNYTPTSSNPYNYILGSTMTKNGYMANGRVDYNFNENTKLFITYNQQAEDDPEPVMLWWQPPNSVPYPAAMGDKPFSRTVSGNLVHVFNPTLTNELTASVAYLKTGFQYGDYSLVSRSATGVNFKGLFKNGSDIIPSLSMGWWIPGYPMLYQPQADHYKSIKVLPNVADNLTKVYKTHTIKFGAYVETTANDQNGVDNLNGQLQYAPGTSGDALRGTIGSNNPVAAIYTGVASSYYEVNKLADSGMTYKTIEFYATDSWKLTKRFTLDLGMRFSHAGEWYDMRGAGAAVFSDSWYQQDMAAAAASGIAASYPGLRWHGMDPSIPITGRKVKPLFMTPHFGMNWDVFGTGNTVIRGGFGMNRFRDQWNTVNSALGPGSGFKSANVWDRHTVSDISNLTPNPAAPSGASALAAWDDQQPLVYNYSFTVSQKMPWTSVFEVSYVGNQSKHLSTYNAGNKLDDLNVVPLGAYFGPDVFGNTATQTFGCLENNSSCLSTERAARPENYRKYRGYAGGSLNVYTHRAYSNYNGLQVSWNRTKGSFFWGVNYTFSKALGISGDKIPNNIDANYGPLGQLDRTHVVNATYSYDLPSFVKGNAILGGIVNGWRISGTTSLQSGVDLNAVTGRGLGISFPHDTGCASGAVTPGSTECNPQWDNKTLLGSPDFQILPGVLCNPQASGTSQFMNGNCYQVPIANVLAATPGMSNYLQGWYNLPRAIGPMFFNSDISLAKTFKVTERQAVEFRAAGFNFLNHGLTSFDTNNRATYQLQYQLLHSNTPYNATSNPFVLNDNFGKATTKYGNRMMEFTVKYKF